MQATNRTVGHPYDETIDYAFYRRYAASLRKAQRTAAAARVFGLAFRIASGAVRAFVRFWSIAPLGITDRIKTRSGRI